MKTISLVIILVVMQYQVAGQTNVFPGSGNAGIGTASPAYKLEVAGDVRVNGPLFFGTTSNPTYNVLAAGNLNLFSPNDLNFLATYVSNSIANIGTNYYGGGASIPIAINSYPFTNQLFLSTNGNVGVATSSPNYKLDVNGEARFASLVNFGTVSFPDRNYFASSNIRLSSPNDLNALNIGITNSEINIGSNYFSGGDTLPLKLYSYGNSNQLYLASNGYIGVGTANPLEKLSVNGSIRTKKIVVTQLLWSDYVFEPSYHLRALSDVEQFIKKYKHLPDIPSAKEVGEKGISVGDNQALLLKKIEELTLYVIQLDKKNVQLEKEIILLKSKSSKNE